MDNPVVSLFQGADIDLSGAKQNEEDEEDLEEQRRRNEELQNLVMEKLDDFNFDESTINSSTNISLMSNDGLQNKYRDTTNPNEQIKILYDVRLREITSLKEEYENYKKEKSKEIDYMKNKLFVYEAEIQQTKVTLKNSQELLVEKTTCISDMKNTISKQDQKIKECENTIQNLQIDINTYQSTITELQLKLEVAKNPFHLGAKKFNSEELQKAHQEQLSRLEALLEEKTKSTAIMEKEKLCLNQQIEKFINIENEDKTIIKVLTKNFESAQKQCHDLIDIIEKLTNENHHLKDRVKEKYIENTLEDTHYQSNSLSIEKLKRMLLDKSVENESLEAKLRDYENNIKEVLEYRELKAEVYKKEFHQCENQDHAKSLILMQNDLQNYKKLIEDKNQQIFSLNSTNKELLEKLEDMLSQTRHDIQNFSHKYNLPQLEKMTENLRKSQEKIIELEEELKKSEERRHSLCTKLQKSNRSPNKDLEMRFNDLKQQNEKDKINFENQLKKQKKELEDAGKEISSLKSYIDQLIDENSKLKLNVKNPVNETELDTEKCSKNVTVEGESLKKQHFEAIQRLQEAQYKIKTLEETIQDLSNGKIIVEGEKCTLRYEITDYKNRLDDQNEIIKDLENEILELKRCCVEQKDIINELKGNPSQENYEELETKVLSSEETIKTLKESEKQLLRQLDKFKLELEQLREEVIRLTKELATETDKNVRRNLEEEQNDTHHALEKHRESINQEVNGDVLRTELKLREEIQKEYLQKLEEIEKRYEKACIFNKKLYKEQSEKLKIQENKYRDQLGIVLTECAQKLEALENDKQEILRKNNSLQNSFENYKQHVVASEEAYKRIIKESQMKYQNQASQWKNWARKIVSRYIDIENIHKNSRENFIHKMECFEKEVAAVEKSCNDKIRKYVKNCKI